MTVLLLLALLPLALADDDPASEQDAPAAEEGWIDLAVQADFGSALETGLAPEAGDPEAPALDELLALAGEEEPEASTLPPLSRARWSVRPYLGLTHLRGVQAAWGGAAGGTVGHQWWSLGQGRARPAGQSTLRAAGLFGQARGWDLHLQSTHGAWLGPVGLLFGPDLRGDRLATDAYLAEPSLAVGPQARLALRLGPLTPWAAATPAWHLAGQRPMLAQAPWHVLTLAGGLALDGRPLGLRLSAEHRTLSIGHAWQASLGLHLRVL